MILRTLIAFLVFASCALSTAAPMPAVPPNVPGPADVVCFGDSITAWGYPAIMAKNLGVTVVNAGVPGNTSAQGLKRMQKDVLDHKPKVVVVLFGSNDCRMAEPAAGIPLDKYEANLNEVADNCEKISAKVIFCTIPPVDEKIYYSRHGKDKVEAGGGLKAFDDYRAAQARVAEKHKIPLIDLYTFLVAHPEWRGPDGVHPVVPAGNELLASEIGKVVGPLLTRPQ